MRGVIIYLVRHGATVANLEDPARLLGQRLDPPDDVQYVSYNLTRPRRPPGPAARPRPRGSHPQLRHLDRHPGRNTDTDPLTRRNRALGGAGNKMKE
jgi:hypothetical protein